MQSSESQQVEKGYCKSGKCGGDGARRRWPVWILPIVGLAALIWFLLRVIPKPSRATYPCQRMAFPLASGFVIWLVGLAGSWAAFRKAKLSAAKRRYVLTLLFVAASVGALWVAMSFTGERFVLAEAQGVNESMGVAKGINPGRVVWVHDPEATDWEGPGDGHWWHSEHTNQAAVSRMMSDAVQKLAGTVSDAAAWDKLFKHLNKTRGKGEVGYKPGEKVIIKVNFVGFIRAFRGVNTESYRLDSGRDYMNTSPQMIIALLRQLTRTVGVKQFDISICDTLAYVADEYYDILHEKFPGVRFIEQGGKFGRIKSRDSKVPLYWSCNPEGLKQDYIPASFAEAEYLINLANLKAHTGAGVTLCAKNHYGSLVRTPVSRGYYDMHKNAFARKVGIYRPLVDLMGHAHFGGKTLLYLVDGLYSGIHPKDRSPQKWNSYPFDGDWTSSLLASQDPVAIDSVGFDLVRAEYADPAGRVGVDDYLHEAAQASNPPSGTFYDPDHSGNVKRLAGLGVHEHWNNAKDKKYSRNLGAGKGIELVAVGPKAKKNIRNTGAIETPLRLGLKLPTKGQRYEGTFQQAGAGPLGEQRFAGNTKLSIARTTSWPASATVQMTLTDMARVDIDGKWITADSNELPPATALPGVPMSELGRSPSSYNPGQAPWSFVSDLWPLPSDPVTVGVPYVEKVFLEEEDSELRFEGSRRITLLGTDVIDDISCAQLRIDTNLDVHFVDEPNSPPLNLQIISNVNFDTATGWPLDAKQKVTWIGKVREDPDQIRDLKIEMSWTLKRVDATESNRANSVLTVTASGAKVVLLADGFEFTEGPAVDAKGNVYFTDQPNNKIHKWSVDGKLSIFHDSPGRANGLYFDKKGNLIACADLNNELWLIDMNRNATVLVTGYKGKKLNGPNDAWIEPKGGIYFTDPFYKRAYWNRGPMEQDGQHVYYLTPEGKLIRVVDDLVQPNGIIGTHDGKMLYVADIGDKKTYVFEIKPDGMLGEKRLFCSMGSDGMTIDNEGNIYLTGRGVTVFNKAGERIEHIAIDEGWTANVCFGGKKMQTLFITAMDSLYAIKMRVKGVR